MITLAIEGSSGSELTYQLSKSSISVGASDRNDVVIRSPGVAPQHLVIQRTGDVTTFVSHHRQLVVLNGERRSRGVLRVGDRLKIGTAVLVFKGVDEGSLQVAEVTEGGEVESAPETGGAAEGPRSELVLYSEPSRLAEARRRMVEIFRGGVHTDLIPPLRAFFEDSFPGRESMLAWLSEEGTLEPIVSVWTSQIPRLPARTLNEFAAGGRFGHLRLGRRHILVYPVDQGTLGPPAFLVVETSEETIKDDELVLAELSRVLSLFWDRVERSPGLLGAWEAEARRSVENALPGSSHAIRVLRDAVLEAARGIQPVLICGRPGSGRRTTASLVASLHPTGPLPVHLFEAGSGEEEALRAELFGLEGPESGGIVERARGGVLVLAEIHRLPTTLQRELCSTIRTDLERAYGPSVRWVATTEEDLLTLVNDGRLDADLFNIFQQHLMKVPSLAERREDLSLLIVSLLHRLASEQGKEVRGIELETLNSLVVHPFQGEMGELVTELRRLVTATPDGAMVRGRVPLHVGGGDPGVEAAPDVTGVELLSLDDLKVVIPGIERIIIDRVLRKTRGNQSKAARILNLSRGALIAKMKDYEIPDYRYLRKKA